MAFPAQLQQLYADYDAAKSRLMADIAQDEGN